MDEGIAAGYLWAWGAYLIGALGLLLTLWHITRPLGRDWRHLLLVSVAALLLTPAPLPGMEVTLWVPALFVVVLEGMFEGQETAAPAGMILLGVWLVGLVISLGLQFRNRSSASRRRSATEQ